MHANCRVSWTSCPLTRSLFQYCLYSVVRRRVRWIRLLCSVAMERLGQGSIRHDTHTKIALGTRVFRFLSCHLYSQQYKTRKRTKMQVCCLVCHLVGACVIFLVPGEAYNGNFAAAEWRIKWCGCSRSLGCSIVAPLPVTAPLAMQVRRYASMCLF